MTRLDLPVLVFLTALAAAYSFEVVGWIVEDPAQLNWETFPWHAYTIVYHGGPLVNATGHASCPPDQAELAKRFHAKGVKMQWGCGNCSLYKWIVDPSYASIRKNYAATIGGAVAACDVDGIEVDFEWAEQSGIVTAAQATLYTQWLAELKAAIGGRLVSADIGVWGLSEGSYPLLFQPWVDIKMLNAGAFDWVNLMSYHYSSGGSILAWEKDIAILHGLWGMDKKRINIGIPYYSFRYHQLKVIEEPTWGSLSSKCLNSAPETNTCDGVVFAGKTLNQRLGAYIREQGLLGAFPWAADYDALVPEHNNTLVEWLVKGLYPTGRGSLPAAALLV